MSWRNRGHASEFGRIHTGVTDAQLEEFAGLVEPLVQSASQEPTCSPKTFWKSYTKRFRNRRNTTRVRASLPRISHIRTDLGPEAADTFERAQALYEDQN
jgi:DNA ligase-1